MHITEGIITGKAAVLYAAAGVSLVGIEHLADEIFCRRFPRAQTVSRNGTTIIFCFTFPNTCFYRDLLDENSSPRMIRLGEITAISSKTGWKKA